jgi:hypothetical protein
VDGVAEIRTEQRGEMRTSQEARWIPFTAHESISATRSRFCWEARIGGGRFGFLTVSDAYGTDGGRLVIKAGGLIPVKTLKGPDFDRGELQRYLSEMALCPPLLLHNSSLEWTVLSPEVIRVRDRAAPETTVEVEVGEDGSPSGCRAERPRMAGKQTVRTPWRGSAMEFRQWEGMRIASRVEASWMLETGAFTYFRSEIISCDARISELR